MYYAIAWINTDLSVIIVSKLILYRTIWMSLRYIGTKLQSTQIFAIKTSNQYFRCHHKMLTFITTMTLVFNQ